MQSYLHRACSLWGHIWKKQKKKQFIESQKHEVTQLYESDPIDFFFLEGVALVKFAKAKHESVSYFWLCYSTFAVLFDCRN